MRYIDGDFCGGWGVVRHASKCRKWDFFLAGGKLPRAGISDKPCRGAAVFNGMVYE